MGNKIGIIDDETLVMKYYERDIKKLKLEISVKLIPGVTEGINWVEKNIGSIFLLVVDTMMPPEDVFSMQETRKGILTGVRLVEKIRRELKYQGLMYVLTNLPTDEAYTEYIRNDEHCRILSKRKCTSKEFARLVKSYHSELEFSDEQED